MAIQRMENETILKDTIDKFGPYNQCLKACEEMAELSALLLKNANMHEATLDIQNHICEEIADVAIMIEQLYFIFNSNEIDRQFMLKLNRLKNKVYT